MRQPPPTRNKSLTISGLTPLSGRVWVPDFIIPLRTPRSGAAPSTASPSSSPGLAEQAGRRDAGHLHTYAHVMGKGRLQTPKLVPAEPRGAILGKGCKGALTPGSDGAKYRAGGGASVRSRREGRGGDRQEASGVGERARRLGARGGGPGRGGAAEPGGRRHRRREGAEPRSQLPPGRRARAEDAARGRARTARTLSKQCSEAPSRAAGGSETRGEAGGARPRGEPAAPSPKSASFFVWQTWPQRGAPGERGGCGAGDPRRRPPGVTGGRWRRVERSDRVRPGLRPRWKRRARARGWRGGGEGPGSQRYVFDSFENRALSEGETFLEFRQRNRLLWSSWSGCWTWGRRPERFGDCYCGDCRSAAAGLSQEQRGRDRSAARIGTPGVMLWDARLVAAS